MGTRAAFWIGDPRKLDSREWLGCKAFDGYPDGLPLLKEVATEEDFRNMVSLLREENDFAKPEGGWPYPWDKDIFLTDYTYAFFDGALHVSCYHLGFVTMKHYLKKKGDEDKVWNGDDDASCLNIPAPAKYDRNQPDSIMIISAK